MPFVAARGPDQNMRTLRQTIEVQVLEKHAPAHVVVNAAEEVVYFSTRTGPYLEHPRGAPERQLLGLTRPELRADVRAVLRAAMADRRHVSRRAFLVNDNRRTTVLIDAEPIGGDVTDTPDILLVFRTEPAGETAPSPDETANADVSRTEALERTICELNEKLQTTIEEYETAVEELKSANEEMLSVNEELQSTNEELEASKEELQSLNEELNTINSELTIKVDEIDRAHSDLRNLYESTQIATVFLDKNLVIRQFTPAAHKFFAIRKGDIGRPLTELASVNAFPDLQEQISMVFADGQIIERQFEFGADKLTYLVRLVPYRRSTGEIEGVVVTFFDVSHLARAQAQQEVLIAELNHRVKNMLTVVIGIVRRTLGGQTGPEFTARLLGRLQAMSRIYSLLSEEHWTDIDLGQLVGQEIAAFGPDRIRTEGDGVRVSPDVALPLSMVLHELATNAAKYGALSNTAGHVQVTWAAVGDRLTLGWAEYGGPAVTPREHDGFGVVLMKGQVEHQLGGTLGISFEPAGLRVEIDIPRQ
jgi:two-component system CheB/CheR fusion protein